MLSLLIGEDTKTFIKRLVAVAVSVERCWKRFDSMFRR